MYIHDIEGVTQMTRETNGIDYREFRRTFPGSYIANNNYSFELACKTLENDDADLISFGRPFIANPDLVERFRSGAPIADAPKNYWYGGNQTGYSAWPTMR